MTNQSTNTTPDSGANNQPTVNEQLDKILGNLWDTAINIGSGSDWNRNKITENKAKLQRLIVEAKHGIVINALNLLNTEPIHTVEQALLFDEERLGKELENDQL